MIMDVAIAPMFVMLLVVFRAAVPVLAIRYLMYAHLAQILAEDPVTQTVPQHVVMNVREIHQWDVQIVPLIALGNVLKPVLMFVKPKHHKTAQIVLQVVLRVVLKHVQMLAKLRHHNTALIVPATVLLDVQPHVLMLVRLRHRKDVLIVLHNVVEIVNMNVLMVVDDNVIRRVVVNAKVSVADHAR